MRALIRFTLAKPVLTNLVFFLLMVMGAVAFWNMPLERFPNVSMAKVYVETFFPGASPDEVEALVTTEIEDALDDLENVEFISSTSYRQRSTVVVKFIDDTDYQAAYRELRFRVLGVLDELPPEVDPPRFNFIDVNDWLPVVSVDLRGARSNQSLVLMAEGLKIALRQIEGVREVKLQGEQTREYHVSLDPARLAALGVTFDQAVAALQAANASIPSGDLTTPGGELVISTDERFRSRRQVMDTVVRRDADGSLVRIRDLATAAGLAYRDPFVLSSVDGEDCVTLQVIKTRAGNALTILEAVKEQVESFQPVLKREGVSYTLTRDSTVQINHSLQTLGMNMAVGIGLVCLVIWAVMGLRNAVITTLGIPFSFLFTMILMYLTGNSLNEITLFSFVLVSGIIVDDAIVVVENIYRRVQEGETVATAVVEGTAEVAWPVIAATATTVCAFLPMLIMTGSTGEFFALIPKAVSFAIAASLFECLFILPLHYQDWGPRPGEVSIDVAEHSFKGETLLMRLVRRLSLGLMQWCLRHRFLSLSLAGLGFVSAVAIGVVSFTGQVPLIKVKFFPDDYSLYYVITRGPVGTPIEATHERLKEIERFVMDDGPGYAVSAKGLAGFYPSEDYEPVFGFNVGHVAVTLPKSGEREFKDPQTLLEEMRSRIGERFAQDGWWVGLRPEKDGPPAGKDLNLRVVGPNPASVAGLAADMMDLLRDDPELSRGISDLAIDSGEPSRVFAVKVDEQRAAEYGVSPRQVILLASAALNGRYIGKYRLVDEEVDLKVGLSSAAVRDPSTALALPLIEHPSGPVRLGDVAAVEARMEPGQLNRFQGERAATITANLRPGVGASLPAVVERIREHYRSVITRFPGASIDFAGEFASTRKSFNSLAQAFLIALLLMYLIMAAQFGSYVQPLIILSAVGFALTGVIYGKFLTQTLFTVNSFVATVGVAGVVVNDALVLIDFLNRQYALLGDKREAIRRAVNIRLRPILLTTITTTLGLLPMAVGIPEYSLIWGSMAGTFVTGLCTATFLTIILVPVLWDLLAGRPRGGRGERA